MKFGENKKKNELFSNSKFIKFLNCIRNSLISIRVFTKLHQNLKFQRL